MTDDHPFYGTPLHTLSMLPRRLCRRGDPGATWSGARWTCPLHGLASILVPHAGRFVGAARAELEPPAWLPYWRRRPADAPRPHDHGPRVIFRGTRDGIDVGGLS